MTEQTEDEAVIRDTFKRGDGIFRLFPAFVPRRFGKAGRRLKLHPDDYFAFGMARGSITERWFSSTIAAQNGELAKADEGLSYVCTDYDSDVKFSLRTAVKVLKGELGKPECYYFPKQLNNYFGEAGYTYFGFDPD